MAGSGRVWTAVAVAFAVAAGAVCAQDRLQPGEVIARTQPYLPRSPYTFRTEVRLVEVGVVVRDSRNRTVSGLGRDSFEIREGRKRHPITAFSVQTFTPAPAPTAAGAKTARTTTGRGRFVGLLFDDLNSDLAAFRNSQLAAERFVKEGLAAGDQVAIFTTTQAQVLPFTADPERLVHAIEELKLRKSLIDRGMCPEMSPYEAYVIVNNLDSQTLETKVEETRRCMNMPAAAGGRGGNQAPPNLRSSDPAVRAAVAQANSVWLQARYTAQSTLGTIRNIVDYLAGLPGTRMMLLASGGFLSGTLEYEQENIVTRALRGGVVINSLDAKGLFATPAVEMPHAGDVRSIINQQLLGTRPLNATNDAIAYLAQSTGGRFFHNSNDLEGGFRELAAVPEVTYLLGFAPDEAPDDKYHKISVRVTSGRGYSVQARPGYFAAIEDPAKAEVERRIDQEVLSGSTLSEAPVTLATQAGPLDDGGRGVIGLLRVDVQRLPLVEKSGARQAQLVFIAALLDQQGNFVTGREGVIDFALSESTFQWLSKQGLTTRFQIEAPPGNYRFRLVAEEPSQKRLTALTQAVEIR